MFEIRVYESEKDFIEGNFIKTISRFLDEAKVIKRARGWLAIYPIVKVYNIGYLKVFRRNSHG